MYFLTIWLKMEDSSNQREYFSSVISEYVKKFCRNSEIEKKISPSNLRITVTLPCDSSEYNCLEKRLTVERLSEAIERKINRVAKAKALCNQ